jgi:hypothetical protein
VKRAVALLLAAALAVGSAGCGGAGSGRLSKSQYEARMGALGHTFSSEVLNFKTTDFKGVPAYFQMLARQLDAVAAQARAIKPPRDVEDLHARIVDGFEKEAAIMKSSAARLRGASAAQVKRLLRQFDSAAFRAALQEIDDAGSALADRGYKINSSAGK